MAAGDIRYVRAPWGPGQLIQYVDTGVVYNEAPIYEVVVSTDNVVSAGLLSVEDSLGYKVGEIERHTHSYERWFGSDGATGGSMATLTPYQVDSGANDWGAWIPLLDANDTPAIAGNVYYDLHEVLVIDAERTTPYRIQIAFGASGAAALAAGEYTEIMFVFPSAAPDGGPVEVQGTRHAAGTPAWARCWNVNAAGGTVDFFIGVHGYEG